MKIIEKKPEKLPIYFKELAPGDTFKRESAGDGTDVFIKIKHCSCDDNSGLDYDYRKDIYGVNAIGLGNGSREYFSDGSPVDPVRCELVVYEE